MSSSACARSDDLVEAWEPHQPASFSFPKRQFGKKTVSFRSFQSSWFRSWSWLHYSEATDSVTCFLCTKTVKEKKMNQAIADAAFVIDELCSTTYLIIIISVSHLAYLILIYYAVLM